MPLKMETAMIMTMVILIEVIIRLARSRVMTWTWICCPNIQWWTLCPDEPTASLEICFSPKHLAHLFCLSLCRSHPSPCLVTYRVTVLAGTPRPKNTAGKTSEDTAMAKEGQGVVKEFPTPGPASLWYWFHSQLLNGMASPHQGSLAPNRSAFNFTQEGLVVRACVPSLAMLNDGMESHLKVLERLHIQCAVPEPPKILTICHTTAARNIFCI